MLRIGDTLSNDDDLEFSGIPRFAPEHFGRVVLTNPIKRKQLDAGLRQLTEEGAAQVFFTSSTETSGPTPIPRSRCASLDRGRRTRRGLDWRITGRLDLGCWARQPFAAGADRVQCGQA